MAVRFFYIAVAETRHLDTIFNVIKEWDDMLHKRRNMRVGVLIRFSKWKRTCLPCKLAEKHDVPLFVDNGAFTYLSASELEAEQLDRQKIVKWLSDYAGWIAIWHNYVTAAAMPDIPVHGRDFLPGELRAKRIEMTAELHKQFARMLRAREPHALEKMIVVLQGYTVEEYYRSLRLHSENYDVLGETLSLNPDKEPYGGVFGIGSVCVRKPSAKGKTGVLAEGKAAGTLRQFMREFLSFNWPGGVRGFHFFGLHTEAVRWFSIHPMYYASDTGAHGLNYRYKWRTVLGCKQLDEECYKKAIESQLKTTLGSLALNPLV